MGCERLLISLGLACTPQEDNPHDDHNSHGPIRQTNDRIIAKDFRSDPRVYCRQDKKQDAEQLEMIFDPFLEHENSFCSRGLTAEVDGQIYSGRGAGGKAPASLVRVFRG